MDRVTLFSVQGSLLIFLGAVVLLAFHASGRKSNHSHAILFALGYLLGGCGLLVQSHRDSLPAAVGVLVGNGLFCLFLTLVHLALARTSKQGNGQFYYLLAACAAILLNFSYFTFWQPSVLVRTAEAIPFMSIFYLSTAVMLLRSKDVVIRPALRAMSAMLFVHSISSYIFLYFLWRYHRVDAWFTWTGIMSITGLALGFLWIDSLRLRHDLETRALTDPLTGLFNRHALETLASRELDRAQRSNKPCSALMLDINRFKEINDQLGHLAGDSALQAVAACLLETLRSTDVATRMGGDEFFILLPEADEASAHLVQQRIRSSLAALVLTAPTQETFRVSISIGQVTRRAPHLSLIDLLHESDLALYEEKQRTSFSKGGAQVQPSSR